MSVTAGQIPTIAAIVRHLIKDSHVSPKRITCLQEGAFLVFHHFSNLRTVYPTVRALLQYSNFPQPVKQFLKGPRLTPMGNHSNQPSNSFRRSNYNYTVKHIHDIIIKGINYSIQE